MLTEILLAAVKDIAKEYAKSFIAKILDSMQQSESPNDNSIVGGKLDIRI
jgi:hypothetical protein